MEYKKYFPFWDKLSDEQKSYLSERIRIKKFKRGERIHDASDCLGFLVVVSGRLRAYAISEEGKELTLYRLLEYDACLFSASCAINNLSFDVMVYAETDAEAIYIPSDVYKRLLNESIVVANYTNELMASRLSDIMQVMDQIVNKRMDSRIANFLLEESVLEESATLKLTHSQIANHLGSAREVASRILKLFESDGAIELGRGEIRILDADALKKIAAN